MKRISGIGILVFLILLPLRGEEAYIGSHFSIDDIILDIYRSVTEVAEMDYEQLQTDLYAIAQSPINLNATTEEELSRLVFLSSQQIDDILAYANRHPFQSVYELRLITSLAEYEIRDLLPFVKIGDAEPQKLYAREVFHFAKHELTARVDARNIEGFAGTDPMYVQARYRFDYQRRVQFGLQLRRPAGGGAGDMQYGGFVQLNDIGCLHTLVAGHFQASFGQGLVMAPVFHTGKSAYVSSVGMNSNGLRYYSSTDGEGLQGVGATLRWAVGSQTRVDASAFYSIKHANDSTLHHLAGANITLRHKKCLFQLSAIENIWSDSIRPYRNTSYNQHYFRGRSQAVLGASIRYNHGWFDAFAEVATAQNYERLEGEGIGATKDSPHWGAGVLAGSRFYPVSGLSLVALYRYYSPYFDNAMGYAFSETSRVGDEHGGYLGIECTRWKNWRVTGYADVFRFAGPKYGIPDYPSIGYDAMVEVQYHGALKTKAQQSVVDDQWSLSLRARTRQKGGLGTHSARLQFDYPLADWTFRTTAEANMTHSGEAEKGYGCTVYQDIGYTLPGIKSQKSGVKDPLSIHMRLQFFDAREWANRIYCYEHDVLYAFSIPAVYGFGGRAYLSLRWKIIPQLALYLRVSETVKRAEKGVSTSAIQTRTDVHFLLRATL